MVPFVAASSLPACPAAMDTEFPPLPAVQSLILAPPLSPQPLRRPVSRSFMACAPDSWRFDIAESSADELGPVEVRIYLVRQHSRILLGSARARSPCLFFFLPFSGGEDWTEDYVLSFTCSQILQQLASWASSVPLDLSPSQLAQCMGKVKWENSLARFCLPVVLCFADSWTHPRDLREWKDKQIAKAFKCSDAYVSSWFTAVASFGQGGDIPLLPPDIYSLDEPASRPEAKRQRN